MALASGHCVIATTPRLLLRLFEMSDAETLHRVVFGDAAVMRYGMGMKTLDETRRWIVKHRRNYEQFRLGKWAVVLRDTNELIGYCGFTAQKMIDDVAETELGYRLAQTHWGNGFATEAATAARDYAFHTLKLPRIIALIDPANTPSIRVAEKLGMQYERDVLLDGYTHPDQLYAINAD